MTRRALLSMPFVAACLRADSAQEVWDLFSSMASALSERFPDTFMAAFDKTIPGYHDLRANIVALLNRADLQSAIEFSSNEGDDHSRTVEAEWILRITDWDNTANSTRRQQRITCRLVKTGKKWHITSFEPLSLFAPRGV